MHRRPPRIGRLAALVGIACLVVAGAALAGFSSTQSNGMSTATDRIFPATHVTSAWSVEDAADGSAADISSTTAFSEGSTFTTGNYTTSFSGSRWTESLFQSPLALGLATSNVTLNFDFASNGGGTACYYVETYRVSSGALLGTHGSSGSPSACVTGSTLTHTTVALTEITTSDLASDFKVRIYGKDSTSNGLKIDLWTVTGSSYSNFTLYVSSTRDQATGSLSTSSHALVAGGDGSTRSTTAWSTAYAAGRYMQYTFPTIVPTQSTISSVSFTKTYRSATNGANFCWYFEVYSGATLLATHGSSGSPVSCNSSNTTWQTDTVSLPEVDLGTEANGIIVKEYGKSSGSAAEVLDLVQVSVTYALGTGSGCASPGTQSVESTGDATVQQANPTAASGTATTANVQSQNSSRNKRMLIFFSMPAVPTGCSVTGAALRVYGQSVAGSRTIQAYQLAGVWNEAVVTWNTQPSTTATPATATAVAGYTSWDVTSIVQSIIVAANYGFLLKDATESAGGAAITQTFRTSEALTNVPTLDITFG